MMTWSTTVFRSCAKSAIIPCSCWWTRSPAAASSTSTSTLAVRSWADLPSRSAATATTTCPLRSWSWWRTWRASQMWWSKMYFSLEGLSLVFWEHRALAGQSFGERAVASSDASEYSEGVSLIGNESLTRRGGGSLDYSNVEAEQCVLLADHELPAAV